MARLLRSLFVTALGTGPPIMRRNPAPILARIASPQTLPAGVGLAGGNGLQLHSSDPSSFSFNEGSGDGKAAWDREGGTRGRSMTVSFMLNADSVSLSSEGGEGKGGPYLKTAQKEGGIGGGVGGGVHEGGVDGSYRVGRGGGANVIVIVRRSCDTTTGSTRSRTYQRLFRRIGYSTDRQEPI